MKTRTTQRRNPADIAVRLVARHLLRGLRKVDWEKWEETYVKDPEKLEKTITLLARVSRELRAEETDRDSRAPTAEEIEEIERRLNLL